MAEIAGADLYEIEPVVPYTRGDLNWMDENARSTIEMKDKSSRPAIKDTDARASEYDVIFVGFPIWWYIAPTIINTFLEKYDLSGKTIVLFATSGGSGFGQAVSNLRGSVAANTEIIEGRVFRGRASDDDLKKLAEMA